MRHMNYHKLILPLLALLTAAVFASCSSDDGGGKTPDTPQYRRTVVVYMAAQNSLGYANAAKADSSEIAGGTSLIPSTRDNLILFIDDDKAPRLYRFYKSTNGKGYYTSIYQYPTDVNSADPSTLLDVLNRVKNLFPSESYGLVLWSHGTGWLPQIKTFSRRYTGGTQRPEAFGIDVGEGGDMETDTKADGSLGDQMEITALAGAIGQSGLHMDYIFFDACIMQSIEVAYDLRNVTDYIVASPAMTSGYGAFYYDQIRNGFFTYPTNDKNIRTIVDTYYHDVMESDTTSRYYGSQGCVMSAIKTSALENLARQTALCLPQAISEGQEADLSGMDGYVDFETTSYPDCYDAAGVMHALLPTANYTAWRRALDACVVYQRMSDYYYFKTVGTHDYSAETQRDIYCGASMFVPQQKYAMGLSPFNYNERFRSTAWYAAAGWAQTGW
jgi:hypothetical protein